LLDTEVGSPAELIYPKFGYVSVKPSPLECSGLMLTNHQYGIVPGLEISPKDGLTRDGIFFYKDMRPKN
jgi:hypothetical protein